MSVVSRVHEGYVHARRVRVLARRLGALIPEGARVLDVGCGDGRLAALIAQERRDITVEGLEVLVREGAAIEVKPFDGRTIPHGDGAFDAVMMVDVLHHTDDPMVLLGEAARVARACVVLKDHLRDGVLAGPTLRMMDWVGNARHGVRLPYVYWPQKRWREAFADLRMRIAEWDTRLGIYPFPANLVFGRGLHFAARLEHVAAGQEGGR